MITSKIMCEGAAAVLSLKAATASELQSDYYAHGCLVLSTGGILLWASPNGHPHPNRPCGNNGFKCICVTHGIGISRLSSFHI